MAELAHLHQGPDTVTPLTRQRHWIKFKGNWLYNLRQSQQVKRRSDKFGTFCGGGSIEKLTFLQQVHD